MKANDGKLLELEHLFCETLPVGSIDEKGNKLTPYYCMNDVAAWALKQIVDKKILEDFVHKIANEELAYDAEVPAACLILAGIEKL